MLSARTRTRLFAVTGVLCISFAAILVRLAGTAPATTAFFRALYALPVLAMIWWTVRRRDHRDARARWTAFAAGVLLAIDLTIWHVSIERIGAGLATVLANVQVVFVGLAAWLIYRERPTRTALVVVPVIFGGVVLLSGLGGEDAYGSDPVGGVVFGVTAGVAYASFLLTLRASNRRHLVPTAGPVLDATAGTAVGALLIGLLGAPGFTLRPEWPGHGWLLVLAFLTQTTGWLLITVALPRLPALETSVIILIQPVGAIIWAYLIFTEALSVVQWAGVVIVLGGILTLGLRGVVRPHQDDAPGRPGSVVPSAGREQR
jgi:drug/metabolite transporter (DMT)-like permease